MASVLRTGALLTCLGRGSAVFLNTEGVGLMEAIEGTCVGCSKAWLFIAVERSVTQVRGVGNSAP